jgi:hypothetical protein
MDIILKTWNGNFPIEDTPENKCLIVYEAFVKAFLDIDKENPNSPFNKHFGKYFEPVDIINSIKENSTLQLSMPEFMTICSNLTNYGLILTATNGGNKIVGFMPTCFWSFEKNFGKYRRKFLMNK